MSYTPEQIAELDVLCQFNLENLQEGLKVHHNASPATIAAFEPAPERADQPARWRLPHQPRARRGRTGSETADYPR